MSESPTPRAQPFYCPYCGEEDFVPYGDKANSYSCNSCTRLFAVEFLGLAVSEREPTTQQH